MNTPRVSILIPCYNASSYVAQALDSALAQTWSNTEIVVINDGSTDASGRIIDGYARHGVTVIHQDNRGQSAAANRAFEACTGEYIKFFDADDVLSENMIEFQMHRLAGSTTAVASCEWGRFHGDKLETYRPNPEMVWRDMAAREWLVDAWMNARPMMQCALWLIPRPLLLRSGLWDERLSLINDFEFFARVLCHASEVRFTPAANIYYRSGHPGVLSQRMDRSAVESAFTSIMLATNHLLAKDPTGKARQACANIFQDFVYTHYPDHRDLCGAAQRRVSELGGSTLPGDWPPRFDAVRRLVGWKLARRVQRLMAGRS